MNTPLLTINHLSKTYGDHKNLHKVLQDINLVIAQGETVGLVGESGCGKSTLGKLLLNLEFPTSGTIVFENQDLSKLTKKEMVLLRRKMQIIFQDPYASLNPRMKIEDIIGEGIDIHQLATNKNRLSIINNLLNQIGLDPSFLNRYPHEFSGGQRQRIGIARALAVDPQFIVCDEALSALDVCTQQQVLKLLIELKKTRNLTYLFISHDLNATKKIADTVVVMYLGRIVEKATTEELFSKPNHPYTQALLAANFSTDYKKNSLPRIVLKGEINPFQITHVGCPFAARCPYVQSICHQSPPPLVHLSPTHSTTCHFASKNGESSIFSNPM